MSIISQTKKKILLEIKDNTFHGYILSKKLEIPISSVYEHLKELREAGLIEYKEEDRRKIYQLTEKGLMLLKAVE
jgi:DNA-binding PadR family transcriptional regulator